MNQNFDNHGHALNEAAVNDSRDPGGMTNLGITKRVYVSYGGDAAEVER